MNKLVLIDGNAILHRAYHALPALTTKSGEPINAVYGLVSMLLRVIKDLRPTHLAVAFDTKAPTFRHKEFALYQSQRPAISEDLISQFEKAKRVFEAIGVPIFEKPGYEADDIIGTISRRAQRSKSGLSEKGVNEVIVVTGDRDLLQLVNKNVKVYMPIVGLTNAKLMDEVEVEKKMGVQPKQIPDYKAMVGDTSDNYPGIPGIGPKTAVELLKRFGNIEGILKHLKNLPPKLAEKIKMGEKDMELYLRLATIAKDVPLEFELEKCSLWDVDNPKVIRLFEEFGFKTLTERIKKVGKEMELQRQMRLL